MDLFTKAKHSELTRITVWLSILVAAIGMLVIFSWLFGALYLITANGDDTIIKINAGFCFLASAVSLLLIGNAKTKKTGITIIVLVFFFNLLNLSQYIFNYSAGIDEAILQDHFTPVTKNPGRMTVNASIYFLFTSALIGSIASNVRIRLAELLIIPVWITSLISVVGYIYIINFPFENGTQLSPIMVLLCFSLSSAILFSRLETGFLAPFSQTTETAKLNTRLLITGIILTLLFSWLRLQGELRGLLKHDAGIVLMGAAFILILMYSKRVSTVRLNALEQKLKKEKELSEHIINSLPAVFFVTDRDNKFIRFNNSFVEASGFSKEELKTMTAHHFFPENEKDKIDQYIKDIKENGLMTIEASLVDKDGVIDPFFFKTTFFEYNGEPCLIGTGINIAERKKAEREIDLLNKQLRSLSKHLDHIREEERTAIVHEIHDELGQQLTVFKINLARLKLISKEQEAERELLTTEMLALTETMIHSIRRIVHDLRPPALEDLGIAEALRIYSDEFEVRSSIPIHFFTGPDLLELTAETSKALYRIYQESLTNVARYADATQVEASLDLEDENIVLTIADNGVGFDIDELLHKKTMGIISMRERALMIGATFEITSTLNKGTTVLVTLPLKKEMQVNKELQHTNSYII